MGSSSLPLLVKVVEATPTLRPTTIAIDESTGTVYAAANVDAQVSVLQETKRP